jgi:hypothetical protein
MLLSIPYCRLSLSLSLSFLFLSLVLSQGVRLWEVPPNGQGMAALMALNILENFPIKGSDILTSVSPTKDNPSYVLIVGKSIDI